MNTSSRTTLSRAGASAGVLALCAALTLGAVSSASATGLAPVAADDFYTVAANGTLAISASSGVLANDTDPEGDPLLVATGALAGPGGLLPGESIGLWDDGHFFYIPPTGFTGSRTFTYDATDGTGSSNWGTITITVTAAVPPPVVNAAPVANADLYAVIEDQWIKPAAPGVFGNDTDADGDAITISSQGYDVYGGVGESLTIYADGSFLYQPPTGFTGTRTWWYVATDGTDVSAKATITFTVTAPAANTAPDVSPNYYAVDTDKAVHADAPGVLVDDSDVDGDTLTVTGVTPPAGGPMAGESLTANADGSFDYQSPTGYSGQRVWTYTASDGAVTAEANLVFTITPGPPANTAPVANPDAYYVVQDTPFSTFAPGYLGNDTDADGDALEWSHLYWPNGGALPGEDLTMTTVDGAFVYTPPTGFTGVRQFMYLATDGTDDSNYATLTFTVREPSGGLVPTIPTDGGDPGTPADSTVPTLASTGVEGAGIAGTAVLAGLLVGGGMIARRTTRREA